MVTSDTAAWRRDTPTLQYALPLALGTRVSVALDLAGIDRILAAEYADLAQNGGFGFGSGWASLLKAQAAWLRGQTVAALEACDQACAALAANRLYDANAHAARAIAAALCGDLELATASMAAAEEAAGSCDGLFYPWRVQAKAWTAACGGDVPGAVRQIQDLVLRLRADGFAGHELLALHDLVRLGRPDLAADRMQGLLATVPGGPRRETADEARPGGRRRLRRRSARGGPRVPRPRLSGVRRRGRGRRGPAVPGWRATRRPWPPAPCWPTSWSAATPCTPPPCGPCGRR